MNKTINFNRTRAKAWVHPSELLIRGHVIYNVKFLGCVEVDQPKGSEMVREAIRKMKFNRQIKKAEGEKPIKVELCISMDAIRLQEPKYKTTSHQFPLHQVSYCADDKSDKRMFTFIAKEKDHNKHLCFVFDSERSAEEITLTVGQAFDLAYKRFLEVSNKDGDPRKQLLVYQKKIQELTQENANLRNRVAYLEKLLESKPSDNSTSFQQQPIVGRKLENLVLDSTLSMSGSFGHSTISNGASHPQTDNDNALPILAPPPPVPSRSFSHLSSPDQQPSHNVDLFGSKPFAVTSMVTSPVITSPSEKTQPESDVFGMEMFSPLANVSYDVDSELLDAQANFSQGLSFGTEDFSLDDLDPLKK